MNIHGNFWGKEKQIEDAEIVPMFPDGFGDTPDTALPADLKGAVIWSIGTIQVGGYNLLAIDYETVNNEEKRFVMYVGELGTYEVACFCRNL